MTEIIKSAGVYVFRILTVCTGLFTIVTTLALFGYAVSAGTGGSGATIVIAWIASAAGAAAAGAMVVGLLGWIAWLLES